MRFSFWPGAGQPYREVETLARHGTTERLRELVIRLEEIAPIGR